MPEKSGDKDTSHDRGGGVSNAQGFQQFLEEVLGHRVRVLITSRCKLGFGLQGAQQLNLRGLPLQHAEDLLLCEATAARATPLQAQELAHICGCNALALKIIGGFIASHVINAEVRHTPLNGRHKRHKQD